MWGLAGHPAGSKIWQSKGKKNRKTIILYEHDLFTAYKEGDTTR